MKRQNPPTLFIVFILFALCGCGHLNHFTAFPAVKGQVVDIKTDGPVLQATVHFRDNRHFRPTALTTNNGTFFLPAERQWGVHTVRLTDSNYIPRGYLIVQSPSYQSLTNWIGPDPTNQTSVVDVGTIRLTKLPFVSTNVTNKN
ncbi:MAG TPA: hypothetical protein VN836_05265 [Verrucomicrobiae bacterium]|nr:hypothetical protein [Verrucomicrobiae bacterium]